MEKVNKTATKKKLEKKINRVKNKTEKEIEEMRNQVEKAMNKAENYVRKNPTKATLISAGIGSALGAAITALIASSKKKK